MPRFYRGDPKLVPILKEIQQPDITAEEVERRIETEARLRSLRNLLRSLPVHYQQVWFLKYQEDLEDMKIAKILKVSRQRFRTMLKTLKGILNNPT